MNVYLLRYILISKQRNCTMDLTSYALVKELLKSMDSNYKMLRKIREEPSTSKKEAEKNDQHEVQRKTLHETSSTGASNDVCDFVESL